MFGKVRLLLEAGFTFCEKLRVGASRVRRSFPLCLFGHLVMLSILG